MEQKTCRTCRETKPATQFHRNKKMADGRLSQCKECQNQANRTRAKLRRKLNPGADNEYVNRWRRKHKDRVSAQAKVLRAVRDGVLHKPEQCSVCRKPDKVEAHHRDYERPLEVRWLCRQCHKDVHHPETEIVYN